MDSPTTPEKKFTDREIVLVAGMNLDSVKKATTPTREVIEYGVSVKPKLFFTDVVAYIQGQDDQGVVTVSTLKRMLKSQTADIKELLKPKSATQPAALFHAIDAIRGFASRVAKSKCEGATVKDKVMLLYTFDSIAQLLNSHWFAAIVMADKDPPESMKKLFKSSTAKYYCVGMMLASCQRYLTEEPAQEMTDEIISSCMRLKKAKDKKNSSFSAPKMAEKKMKELRKLYKAKVTNATKDEELIFKLWKKEFEVNTGMKVSEFEPDQLEATYGKILDDSKKRKRDEDDKEESDDDDEDDDEESDDEGEESGPAPKKQKTLASTSNSSTTTTSTTTAAPVTAAPVHAAESPKKIHASVCSGHISAAHAQEKGYFKLSNAKRKKIDKKVVKAYQDNIEDGEDEAIAAATAKFDRWVAKESTS